MSTNYIDALSDIADRLAQVSALCLVNRLDVNIPTSQRISLGTLEDQLDSAVIMIRTNMMKIITEKLTPDIFIIQGKTKKLDGFLKKIDSLEKTIDSIAKVVSFSVALTTQDYKGAAGIIYEIVKDE